MRPIRWLVVAACALLTGCICVWPTHSDPPTTHGIPHLLSCGGEVYRSGQPPCEPEAWEYVCKLGLTNIIKLDTDMEGDDCVISCGNHPAPIVRSFPIGLIGQLTWPSDRNIHAAVDAITPHTLVHCVRGNDRTGLIIACYRLRCGWVKSVAEMEMMADGFHKAEIGLWNYWLKQKSEDWKR